MKLKLRDQEINLTKDEARQVSEALLAGTEFIKIGDELINSKYIIGIFYGQEPETRTDRLIVAPKPKEKDLEKIGKLLGKTRTALKRKGIIK